MQLENYFPLGIAEGASFIGRKKEADWLNSNIKAGIHTLLLAPRRYGKSSLVLHVLNKQALHFIEIDLQLCRTSQSVESKIIHGVESIVSLAISEKAGLLKTARNFFKRSKKQWGIGFKGVFHVSLEPEHHDDIADNILTSLLFLEEALAQAKKNAVIFIDEMQEILSLDDTDAIQGAIRHFAQKSSHVSFIFSGSSRRLLQQMFTDTSKPLYQLCDLMTLNKISEATYHSYLQKVAKKTLTYPLPDDIIDAILYRTDRHPRRTYNLCLYVWRLLQGRHSPPNNDIVDTAWKNLIEAEAKGIRFYLSRYNNSQLKVLAYICLHKNKPLTSKSAQVTMDLSATAITKALRQFETEDIVQKNEDGLYTLIDPVIASTIIEYEPELLS